MPQNERRFLCLFCINNVCAWKSRFPIKKGRIHVKGGCMSGTVRSNGGCNIWAYLVSPSIIYCKSSFFRRQEWMGIIWFSQWTLKTPFQLSILHIQQLGMTPLHGFFNRKPHPVVSWGTPEIFHVEVFVSFRHFHGIRHDSERKKHQWKLVRWVAMWS